MKKQTKIILGVTALVVVIAVLLGVYYATRPDTNQGAKALTIVVVHGDGSEKDFTIHTDAEYLAEALYPIYIYVAMELMFWGLGLWNLMYLYVWLVLFFLTLLFRHMESPWGWAILSGAFGLSFGLLCTPVYWITGGWAFGLSWWISGIPWDVVHCVGNFVIALVLVRPLRRGLSALKLRYFPENG